MFTLLALVPLVLAQETSVPASAERAESAASFECQRCADSGEVECLACAKTTCAWSGEGRVATIFCSQAAECRACLGTRRIACTDCARGLPAKTAKLRTDTEA